MADSHFPNSLREIQRAARHIIRLMGNASLNEVLSPWYELRVLPAAQAHLAARTAHRSAQAAVKLAHKNTVEANTAADNALKMLEAAARFNRGSDTAALLRSLRDGKALNEITGLPNAEQPEVVEDYLQRMGEFVTTGQIPRAHVEEVRTTNEVMAAAVAAETAAGQLRGETSATFSTAKQAFTNRYRVFVTMAEDELGEEGVRNFLVRFARSAGSAGESSGEEEDDGDDDTVDEGAVLDGGALGG